MPKHRQPHLLPGNVVGDMANDAAGSNAARVALYLRTTRKKCLASALKVKNSCEHVRFLISRDQITNGLAHVCTRTMLFWQNDAY